MQSLFYSGNYIFKIWWLITFEPLIWKLLCGINVWSSQWYSCIFILCCAHLKLALLLHKTVLVNFPIATTVVDNMHFNMEMSTKTKWCQSMGKYEKINKFFHEVLLNAFSCLKQELLALQRSFLMWKVRFQGVVMICISPK